MGFTLPPPPFCLIPTLLNQSYIQVEQCPILSGASISSYSVSPHAICPLHLYSVSFLCLQLCLKVSLCLLPSSLFSSLTDIQYNLYIHNTYANTHTHLMYFSTCFHPPQSLTSSNFCCYLSALYITAHAAATPSLPLPLRNHSPLLIMWGDVQDI